MIFTTPCFVRVEDAKAMRTLDMWLDKIGYEWKINPSSEYKEGRYRVLDEEYVKNALTVVCSRNKRMWTTECSIKKAIDCGDNIELFKALAAMNNENDYMQYLIDNVGNMGICTQQSPYKVVQMAGISFNIDNYRKATAQEIIEHFNRKQI